MSAVSGGAARFLPPSVSTVTQGKPHPSSQQSSWHQRLVEDGNTPPLLCLRGRNDSTFRLCPPLPPGREPHAGGWSQVAQPGNRRFGFFVVRLPTDGSFRAVWLPFRVRHRPFRPPPALTRGSGWIVDENWMRWEQGEESGRGLKCPVGVLEMGRGGSGDGLG